MVEIFENIRKIYDFEVPCEPLSAYIEFFSESSRSATDEFFNEGYSEVKMYPSWTPTFYINLGTPYLIDLQNLRYKINSGEDVAILRNTEVVRYLQPEDHIFTVKFYPGGLEAILGLSQLPFQNKVIHLNEFLPVRLLLDLKTCISFKQRVCVMESFLLNKITHRPPGDHYQQIVFDAIGEFSNSGMQLNTSEVAERIFLTSKTINRYFNRVIGLGPKAYFSLIRTRAALNNYMAGGSQFAPWEHGYYDHGHFYKDVVKLTGRKLSDQQ
jgi:AraC-like DNA-binding protein